ncbi:MAG TPA: exodeoxyribonuclease VII large subunit [Dissulfurispiraceae bacterium]|nr:exodeoxyribonuclease VII large subunit [Dissulfurispiraceae bacterium]
MEQLSLHKPGLTLFELNSLIKTAITQTLPDLYWVMAEIAESKCNQKGHCYLDLIEKEGNKTIAQTRATIWAYDYRILSRKFELATKSQIRPGIKVLLLTAVSYHEVYGLSLNVKDIDPAYTIGEMALRKREIVERLQKEGILDRNKELPLPIVPQNIAVISSPTAAGYGDFVNQLDGNLYGFKFNHVLFAALMQGADAEESIIKAFDRIEKSKTRFDVVAIIRGGGSVADLSSFDNYRLGRSIALFPLPVVTGIGHEKDDTVSDIAAHTKMKTPTAVAEFLISGVRSFEERIDSIANSLQIYTDELLSDAANRLSSLAGRLSLMRMRATAAPLAQIGVIEKNFRTHVRLYLQQKQNRLDSLEQAIRHLDPSNVMKRGYSITRANGKVVKDSLQLIKGDIIETELFAGSVSSVVVDGGRNNGAE